VLNREKVKNHGPPRCLQLDGPQICDYDSPVALDLNGDAPPVKSVHVKCSHVLAAVGSDTSDAFVPWFRSAVTNALVATDLKAIKPPPVSTTWIWPTGAAARAIVAIVDVSQL
jgi:hypothetical protein